MLAVSANSTESMGRVPSRSSRMASAILVSPGDPDRGPGGGEKDSLQVECCESEGRSDRPSELMGRM